MLPAGHPRAAAVVDAARQAAGVADQRLVRVLDVGTDDGRTYVVSEWVDGDTLTELVRHGPLVAEQARTLVGETALALEQARRRGLHHLVLSTDAVLRLDDGAIKVAGLAVDAALAGLEVDRPDDASRHDTFSLAALCYAALTGFWPTSARYRYAYDLADSPIPAAPDVAGSPVAPAQIVSGVPADLDTLCRQAFAGRGAPDTPGELAGQIAPWGERVAEERARGVFPLALPPLRRDTDERQQHQQGPRPAPPAGPTSPAREVTPPGPARANLTETPTPVPAAPSGEPPVPSPGLSGRAAAPPAPPRATALPTLGPTDVEPAGEWGELFDVPREAPAPLVPPTPLERPPGTQTRTVLLMVGIFVVIMLAVAKCGLSGLGDNAFVERSGSSSGRSAAPSSTPTQSATTPPATPETPATGAPLRIAAVSSFDPEGDGEEKESLAAKAIDGDPKTVWTSDAYTSATFSGLKKGVGLRLDLGKTTTAHRVSVTVPRAGTDLEVRALTGSSLKGSAVLADVEGLEDTTTVTLEPAPTRYLLLWFTKAAPDDDGYRVAVSEVTVS